MWRAYLGPVEDGGPQAGVQAKLMTLAALGCSVAELGEQVAGVHHGGGQGQTPGPLELLGSWTNCLCQQPAHKSRSKSCVKTLQSCHCQSNMSHFLATCELDTHAHTLLASVSNTVKHQYIVHTHIQHDTMKPCLLSDFDA